MLSVNFSIKIFKADQPVFITDWSAFCVWACFVISIRNAQSDGDGYPRKFLEAFNRLLSQREFIQQDIKTIIAFLTDTKALRAEATDLYNEMDIVTALMKQAIQQNARGAESGRIRTTV